MEAGLGLYFLFDEVLPLEIEQIYELGVGLQVVERVQLLMPILLNNTSSPGLLFHKLRLRRLAELRSV